MLHEIIDEIKSLDKNSRIELARMIRTDADAWNAVNGIGGGDDSSPSVEPGLLSGIVSDESGFPIEGADVEAIGDGVADLAITDPEGQYEMPLLAGNYAVSFQKEGYVEHVEEVVIISEAITNADVHLLELVPPPVE